MYAVVQTGGKQYKIEEGQILRFEKIPGDIGSAVKFDQVLMFSDGENVQIGQPVLDHVTVEGLIVEQGKARKIIVFKYKRRKRYRRKLGHRQPYTAVKIDSIKADASQVFEKPEPEAAESEPDAQAAETQGADDQKTDLREAEPKKAQAQPEAEGTEAKDE